MSFDLITRFLDDSTLGLFGAGHLGRAIAKGLLAAGLPRRNLAICHRGSEETDRELTAAGLADPVAGSEALGVVRSYRRNDKIHTLRPDPSLHWIRAKNRAGRLL